MDSLKCEKCNQRDATHHEATRSEDGKSWVDVHLCDRCLGEVASLLPNPAALIQTFLESESAAAGAPDPAACPDCGITYPEFRARGRLGCPRDYEFFAAELGPLMASIHQGGTQHRGRAPSRRRAETPAMEPVAPPPPPVPPTPEDPATALRRSLDEAVAEERYEDAAALRDRLEALASGAPSGQPGSEAPPTDPPKARKRAPRKRKPRPAPENPPPDAPGTDEAAP
jgi:protein arginine kinase activator